MASGQVSGRGRAGQGSGGKEHQDHRGLPFPCQYRTGDHRRQSGRIHQNRHRVGHRRLSIQESGNGNYFPRREYL